jgi:hypothetical protein
MKTRIIKTLTHFKTATMAILGILAAQVFAAAPEQSKQDKFDVCHAGKLITVAAPAVAAHLRHGDSLPNLSTGECGVPFPDPDRPPLPLP